MKKLLVSLLAAGLVLPTATANANFEPGKLTATKDELDLSLLFPPVTQSTTVPATTVVTTTTAATTTVPATTAVATTTTGVEELKNKKSDTPETVLPGGGLLQGATSKLVAWTNLNDPNATVLYAQPSDNSVENGALYNSKIVVTSKNGKNGKGTLIQPVAVKKADGTWEYEVKEYTVELTFDGQGNAYIVPGSEKPLNTKTGETTTTKGGNTTKTTVAPKSVAAAKAVASAKAKASSAKKAGAKTLPKTSATK